MYFSDSCSAVTCIQAACVAAVLAHSRPSALLPCGCTGCTCSLVGVPWGRFPCFAVRNECPSTSPVSPQAPVSGGLWDIHRGGELASCRASAPADRQTECVQSSSGAAAPACVSSRSPRSSPLGAIRLQRCVRTPS